MHEMKKGACLCGQVEISIEKDKTHIGACHCGMCRTWSGGAPFISVECGTQFNVKGQEHIARYTSSQWAERGFCKHCGTHLFYHLLGEHGGYYYASGLFANQSDFKIEIEVFSDQKPDFYPYLSAKSTKMTQAEVFAMVAQGSIGW